MPEFARAEAAKIVAIFVGKGVRLAFVYGVVGSLLRHAEIVVAEDVGADGGVECEAEGSAAGGVNEDGGRAINNVASGYLF